MRRTVSKYSLSFMQMLTRIDMMLAESTSPSTRARPSMAAMTRSGEPLTSSMPDMSADRIVVEYRLTSSAPLEARLPKPSSRSRRTIWFWSARRTSRQLSRLCSSSGLS